MQDNATLSANFDSKLTPIQERAVVALLSHANTRTAAKAVGVDEATLWRWLQDKDFHAAYMNWRRESVRQSIARLQQAQAKRSTLCERLQKTRKPRPMRASLPRKQLLITL